MKKEKNKENHLRKKGGSNKSRTKRRDKENKMRIESEKRINKK